MTTAGRRRNDVRQYDDLAEHWWRPDGEFAALHWLAAARAVLVPPPSRPGAVLVDVACGGGILAAHVHGYRHVGVDLTHSALLQARDHDVLAVRGDAVRLPLRSGCADVVVAGEVFEHVVDLEAVVAEAARVLAPGGLLVCDTIADTSWARFSLVTVGERLPGGPPRRIHDPALFVSPTRLRRLCADQGIELEMRGLRVAARDYLAFLFRRDRPVRLRPTRSLAGLYQGLGRKAEG